MTLLGLLHLLYLYVFGFERTRVRMSDGSSFLIPESIHRVQALFTRGLRTHEWVVAYRMDTPRRSRVVLNPYQWCVLEEL